MTISRTGSVLQGHLVTVTRAVQLGFLLVALSTIPKAYDTPTFELVLKCIASASGAGLLSIVVYLAKSKRENLAAKCALLIAVFTLMLLIFAGGGMYSISMCALPLALVFSALFAATSTYIPLVLMMCFGITLIGANNVFDWIPINEAGFGEWARLKDGTITMTVSAYVAWVVGRGLKKTFTGFIREKEEVAKAQAVIQGLAERDSLTGLLNRASAKEAYDKAIESIKGKQQSVALYFIDLDHFKSVNDLFDHTAGDKLLKTVAERLQLIADENTVAARLGGDEFLVFQRIDDEVKADALAERIRDIISHPHNILGAPAQVTASIGITKVKRASFDQACKEADMAMYKVKHGKKNGYQFYSGTLQREYMTKVNVIHGLRDALKKDLLALHYQPKVDLVTGEVLGVEALMRWTKNNPNNYVASEFMPIVESSDLVHEIGRWAIQKACRVCSSWHKQGHRIAIAVNVSPQQLAVPGFCVMVEQALNDAGLEPKYLELELTEHLLIKEKDELNDKLKRIKALGVRFSIDDFGTGYSNLGYLTQLRVDVLKLDRSFIVQMSGSRSTLAVVKAIVSMARVLKLKVVAEGVETEAELNALRDIGCDIGQGYIWSKPLTSCELLRLVTQSKYIKPSECGAMPALI
ncbi:bifunctional diguanylate cyclase/phosphodiesterase [Leucothrix sargassi]|nr:bifunctional diguanylate cyclase/phosphodiesterase [Leucothrix sargassi]